MMKAQAAKERYWTERSAREEAFVSKLPGGREGYTATAREAFSKAEKPFAAEVRKASGEAGRRLERSVGRSERAEGVSRKASTASTRERHVADIARANENLEQIRKRNLPFDETLVESAKWHALKQDAEQRIAKMPTAEQRGVQQGERGGRFYISSTGQKVYIKDNPGAEIHGHMRAQRFHAGLPMSVHLAEPKKPV
jgi:hypothetical protein